MSRRILVADDSSTIQKVIKIAFARYPVEMLEASSLVEALSMVARVPPAALILDASLPGAQGPQDFVKLSKDSGGSPVLLLVGTYESIDEAQFRASGFNYFLRKPFDSTDLVNKVDEMLAGALSQTGSLSDNIPAGSTQRPAHATVIHPGGLPEIERQSLGAIVPPPPPPPPGATGRGRPSADFVPPPPPPGRRSAAPTRLEEAPAAPLSSGSRPLATQAPKAQEFANRDSGPSAPGRGSSMGTEPEIDDFATASAGTQPGSIDWRERGGGQVFEPSSRPSRRLPVASPLSLDEDDIEDMEAPRGMRPDPAIRLSDEDSGSRMMTPPPPAPPASPRRAPGPMVGFDESAEVIGDLGGAKAGLPLDRGAFSSFMDQEGQEPRLELTGIGQVPEPPPLATDERRRGRRAFAGNAREMAEDLAPPPFGVAPPPPPKGREPMEAELNMQQMRDELLARLESELPALVRDAVESYCERHFKSLAREIIAAELRRLADEKARHLVDP